MKRIVGACFALAALLAALVAASPAAARPPALQSAGASGGLVTAKWSLPPSVSAQFFEVSKYPDVNSFGYFECPLSNDLCKENPGLVRFGVLASAQTSLAPSDPTPALEAGTYYLHVAGHDSVHRGCADIEFSDVAKVVIDAGGSAAPAAIVAPGTGDCTRIRGSGGGGGGTAVPGDKTAPTTQLRFSRKQDIDKLRLRARMSEPGTFRARALVDVGGLLARVYNFRPVRRKVTGGVLTTLRPKLSAKNKRALKRAMRRGKRLRARVTITATDRSGNTSTRHAVIRLRP